MKAELDLLLTLFLSSLVHHKEVPLFSTMFNSLCVVNVTICLLCNLKKKKKKCSASALLSFLRKSFAKLIGYFSKIIGLYVVLWVKAIDLGEIDGSKATA